MGIFQPAILVYQRVIATLHLQIDVWKNRFPFEMASWQVFELLVLLGKTFSGVKDVRLFLKFRNHHFLILSPQVERIYPCKQTAQNVTKSWWKLSDPGLIMPFSNIPPTNTTRRGFMNP